MQLVRRAPEVTVEVLVDPDDIRVARRLQARRYLDSGFIDHVDSSGVIDDPWVDVSIYFGVTNTVGEILGVSRLIPYTAEARLPVIEEFELLATERTRFEATDPATIAEVSALAVSRQAKLAGGRVAAQLYRAMGHYSLLVDGRVDWYAALDSRVMKQLVRTYGFLFEPIGPPRHYLGSPTVPARLNLFAQARHYSLSSANRFELFADDLEFDLTGPEPRVRSVRGDHVPRTREGGRVLRLAAPEAGAIELAAPSI